MYIPKETIKKALTISALLILCGGLFLLGVTYALAFTGENGQDDTSPPAQPAPEVQPEAQTSTLGVNGLDPSELALANGNSPADLVIQAIPIQGRLTDTAGLPINGTRDITMRLYDAMGGGNLICEDTDTVSVVNGLFSTYMDYCTPADIDGTQLYLAILIQGEASEMTPRQPIYITPYAYSLVNGAHIGALVSSADTEIFVSPQIMVHSGSSDVTFLPWSDGYMVIDANIVGTQWVYVPVNVPAQLFGTDFKLKSVVYCYDLDSAANYITEVDARYVSTDGIGQIMISDVTDRASLTWTCVTITDPSPVFINGSMMIRFVLNYADTTNYIKIGQIKLVLTQQ